MTKLPLTQMAVVLLFMGVLGFSSNVRTHLEAVADGLVAGLLLVARRPKPSISPGATLLRLPVPRRRWVARRRGALPARRR